MLATVCSRLVEVPVTVLLRWYRLGGPGRTGSAARATVVRRRPRGTRDKRGGTLSAAQEPLVCGTRETVVPCISRLISKVDKKVRRYSDGRRWLRNQAGSGQWRSFKATPPRIAQAKETRGERLT